MKRRRYRLKSSLVILAVILLMSATLPLEAASSTFKDSCPTEEITISSNTSPIKELKNRFNQHIEELVEWNKKIRDLRLGILSNIIHTECSGVEKSTEIYFGISNGIDVDNDPDTGVNGMDIEAQYFFIPWIEFEPDIGIGFILTLSVKRIGQEITNDDLRVFMGIDKNNIQIGYWSPDEPGNEIPASATVTFKFLFYLEKGTLGYSFGLIPNYNGNTESKKITLFAEYTSGEGVERSFQFEYDPPVETSITIKSTPVLGKWNYQFKRVDPWDSTFTARFTTKQDSDEKETIFVVDKLPKEMVFDLKVTPLTKGGGQFLYESSEMYNVNLIFTSTELGNCSHATIINTPRRLFAEWTPTFTNGHYSLEIDSDGTDFALKDSLNNPYVNLAINDLKTIDIDATWNLTNPGDFTVRKYADLDVDLNFIIGNWNVELNARPIADYISTSWLIDTTGYLTIDTGWKSLRSIDLLIKEENFGLHTIGETFKADNFEIDWTIWPIQDLYLDISGRKDFASTSIDIYLNGEWLQIWPLPW
jgi:hypothetical protein